MAAIVIKEVCPRCGGTGIDKTYPSVEGVPEKPCENCDAIGVREIGFSEDLDTRLADLEDKVNDVLDKVNDIKEKVDEIKEKLDEE